MLKLSRHLFGSQARCQCAAARQLLTFPLRLTTVHNRCLIIPLIVGVGIATLHAMDTTESPVHFEQILMTLNKLTVLILTNRPLCEVPG